jgi:hypothetical protein
MQLAPHRPYNFVAAPIPTPFPAARFTPEIVAKARKLGLTVTDEADDMHRTITYVFGIAETDGSFADPLYTAAGPHSALRFLDHHAARQEIV